MIQPSDCQCSTQALTGAVTIITIVVPAVVAIMVTWLAHLFTARRESSKISAEAMRARKTLLREKLESVIALVGEQVDARDAYAMDVVALGIYSSLGIAAPSSISSPKAPASDRAEAIVTLYFPALSSEMAGVRAAALSHLKFISAEFETMRADMKGYANGAATTASTRIAEAMRGLIYARTALAVKARQMIEGELAP